MNMSAKIPLGIRMSTGQIVGVQDLKKGLERDCICPLCRTPLVVNEESKLRFLSHEDDSACSGDPVRAGLCLLLENYLKSSGVVCFPDETFSYQTQSVQLNESRAVSFKEAQRIETSEGGIGFLCTSYQDEKIVVIDTKTKSMHFDYRQEKTPVLSVDIEQFETLKSGNIKKRFVKSMTAGKKSAWFYFPEVETREAEEVRKAQAQPKRPPPIQFQSGLIDFKAELNEEQYAAVTAPDGPALVVAAAGTGKTRTLTYRLAYLLTEKGVQPYEVLLLTFTNKAAREMTDRAEELVGQRFNGGYSGTFHSFANRLLRRHATKVDFGTDFTILDSDDSKKLVRSCMDELKVEKKHFPKPDVILSLLGVTSGRMGDLAVAVADHFELTDVDSEKVLDVLELYQKRKKAQNAMDFDDLLVYALKLLKEHEDVREFYQHYFRYVLVDEYQDTNAIQEHLVQQLVCEHGNLMVVGDDFQSIYSWRGADYRNFLDFESRYRDTATYKLETNYRSIPEILDVANSVIAGNPEQFQKELKPVRGSSGLPHLVRPRDGKAQARYVIEKVRQLNRSGMDFSDICVLYRAHFHAMELQMALSRESMPYVLTSGVRFFEQAHIKDVCSVLRILVNPSDEMAFTRLIEMFPKVGAKTALKIFRALGNRCNLQRADILERVHAALPKAAKPEWEKIAPIFEAYVTEDLRSDPGDVIFRFAKEFYSEYMVENFDNHKYRQEDIDGLIDFTANFNSAEEFLSEIALQSNLDGDVAAEEKAGDGIRLSTVHQAKGLEWKAVFILFACEDMFPSKKAAEESGDAEERRLFYVAVTRAEDELFLCSPLVRQQRDGGMIFLDASRFLEEIPEGQLKEEGRNVQPYTPPSRSSVTEPRTASAAPWKKPEPASRPERAAWEREKQQGYRLSINDFKFIKGAAETILKFDRFNLKGLNGPLKYPLKLKDSSFHPVFNHLKKLLSSLPDGKSISLEVSISYTAEKITECDVISCDLKDYLESRIERVVPQYIHKKLQYKEGRRRFMDLGAVLKDVKGLPGVESERDLARTFFGEQSKHGQQVDYLSEHHLSVFGSINLGIDDLSILALLAGEGGCYFVWEMVDDENATYLWKSKYSHDQFSQDASLYEAELQRVLSEIESIPDVGRIKYKAGKPDGFSFFDHDYESEGFEVWAGRLNNRIGCVT